MADLAGSLRSLSGPLGSWYTWWKGDALPTLSRLPSFMVEQMVDSERIAQLHHVSAADIDARLQQRNRCYVVRLDSMEVAYGWCATTVASIGELNLTVALPPGNRYLWDFVTAPSWRGRGIYPRLLQAILVREEVEADRFWIGNAPQNASSARGIVKAGFQRVGELTFSYDKRLALLPDAPTERNEPAAAILGVRLLTT